MPELELPWGRMRYSEAGDGAPLLFLHGTGCDNADWAGALARLPRGRRVVCAEFRGHGRSDTPGQPFGIEELASDALALVEARGWEGVTIVGHSLGGMVGLAAARRDRRICRLILLEGWTSLAAARAAFPRERHYGALAEADIAAIKRKDAETRARFEPAIWQGFWRTVEDFDVHDYLRRAEIPILEIYGELGRRAESAQALRVPDNPRIAWRWIAGAGHYLPHERPAEVAEAITDWTKTHEITAETQR
jgi:pimeloyl-ACP methyl ester carboxylesterase